MIELNEQMNTLNLGNEDVYTSEPIVVEGEKKEKKNLFKRITADIGGGLQEAIPQAAWGAAEAFNETGNAVEDAVNWITKNQYDIEIGDIPEGPEATTVTGGLVRGISQFATGFIGAGKIIKPYKWAKKLRTKKWKIKGEEVANAEDVVKSVAASTVAFDPHEERFSDLIQNYPALENPVTEYLQSDSNDSAAEGRFKNAVEDLILNSVGAPLTYSLIKGAKVLKKNNDAKVIVEKPAISLSEAQKQIDFETEPMMTVLAMKKKDSWSKPSTDITTIKTKMPTPVGSIDKSKYPSDVTFKGKTDKETAELAKTGEHLSAADKEYAHKWRIEKGDETAFQAIDPNNWLETKRGSRELLLTSQKQENIRYTELPNDTISAKIQGLDKSSYNVKKARRLQHKLRAPQYNALLKIWDDPNAAKAIDFPQITKEHKLLAAQISDVIDVKPLTKGSEHTYGLIFSGSKYDNYTSTLKKIDSTVLNTKKPTGLQIAQLTEGSLSPGTPFNPDYAKEYMAKKYKHSIDPRRNIGDQIAGNRNVETQYERLVRDLDQINVDDAESTLAVFNWGGMQEQGLARAYKDGLVKEYRVLVKIPNKKPELISLGWYKTDKWDTYLDKHVRGKEKNPLFPKGIGTKRQTKTVGEGYGATGLYGSRYTWFKRAQESGLTPEETKVLIGHRQLTTTEGYLNRVPERAYRPLILNSIKKGLVKQLKEKPYEAHRNFNVLAISFETGARPSEIFRLKVKDINFNTGQINIPIKKVKGKAHTRPRKRMLAQATLDSLNKLRAAKVVQYGREPRPNDALFSKIDNPNVPITKDDWKQFEYLVNKMDNNIVERAYALPSPESKEIPTRAKVLSEAEKVKRAQAKFEKDRGLVDPLEEKETSLDIFKTSRKFIAEQETPTISKSAIKDLQEVNIDRIMKQVELMIQDFNIQGPFKAYTPQGGKNTYRFKKIGDKSFIEIALPSLVSGEDVLYNYKLYINKKGQITKAITQQVKKGNEKLYKQVKGRGYFLKKSLLKNISNY